MSLGQRSRRVLKAGFSVLGFVFQTLRSGFQILGFGFWVLGCWPEDVSFISDITVKSQLLLARELTAADSIPGRLSRTGRSSFALLMTRNPGAEIVGALVLASERSMDSGDEVSFSVRRGFRSLVGFVF